MTFYKTTEFAALSGVSIKTLKRWKKAGKLVPISTDEKSHHLYSEEQIEEVKKIFGKKFPTSENKKFSNSESPKKVAPKKDEPLPVINHPAKNFIIPIDKLSKNIFDTTNHSQKRGIIECKKPLITTKFDLEFLKGEPTKFDKIVFCASISEQAAENEFTTLSILHRAMGGNDSKLTPQRKDAITHSIEKLSAIRIRVEMNEVNEKFGYNGGKKYSYHGYILPLEYIKKTEKANTTELYIHFLRKSPLLEIAEMKGQFISYDNKILAVPIRNTETISAIKQYLLERVLEIKGSYDPKRGKRVKKLQPVILLDTLFVQCGLADSDKWQRQDARKIIENIMSHFQAEQLIHSFEFVKQNGKFHSVKFTWNEKS
ncbi:MAG: MerR family transcriptional regulator [Selenomonadaceae bacterium]|nr:MerR family transcriptional regulator [Selenomonadaceae bacterium]